jgi:hypothetical protein
MKRFFVNNEMVAAKIRLSIVAIGIVVGVIVWQTILLGILKF